MLFMNPMEPVRYMAAYDGVLIEFCCDCNDHEGDKIIAHLKNMFYQLGYNTANIGFHKYKVTDRVFLMHCMGNGYLRPVGLVACYVDQNITDQNKINEICDTLIEMYKGFFPKTFNGTVYTGKEMPNNE